MILSVCASFLLRAVRWMLLDVLFAFFGMLLFWGSPSPFSLLFSLLVCAPLSLLVCALFSLLGVLSLLTRVLSLLALARRPSPRTQGREPRPLPSCVGLRRSVPRTTATPHRRPTAAAPRHAPQVIIDDTLRPWLLEVALRCITLHITMHYIAPYRIIERRGSSRSARRPSIGASSSAVGISLGVAF